MCLQNVLLLLQSFLFFFPLFPLKNESKKDSDPPTLLETFINLEVIT